MRTKVFVMGAALAGLTANDADAAVTAAFCRPGGMYCVCNFDIPHSRMPSEIDWVSPKPLPSSNSNGSLNSCMVSGDTGDQFNVQPRYGTEREMYWTVPKPNSPNNNEPDCWPHYFPPTCQLTTTDESYPQSSGTRLTPDYQPRDIYPYPDSDTIPLVRIPNDVPPIPPTWPGPMIDDTSPTPFPQPGPSPLPWPSHVDTWEELHDYLFPPNPNPTVAPSPTISPTASPTASPSGSPSPSESAAVRPASSTPWWKKLF